jgi:hypothetical protein
MANVRTMVFKKTRQTTIDTYKNEGGLEDAERRVLKHYYRDIKAFQDIIDWDFDVTRPYEAQCILDNNVLCAISHGKEDNTTERGLMPWEGYQLVVTWPRDGRKEYWELMFGVKSSGVMHDFHKMANQYHTRGYTKAVHDFFYDATRVVPTTEVTEQEHVGGAAKRHEEIQQKMQRLYQLRDGLSQVSWLWAVLEKYGMLHPGYVGYLVTLYAGDMSGYMSSDEKFDEEQKWICEHFIKRYTGSYKGPAVIYRCFEKLSEDVGIFAGLVSSDQEWIHGEDDWGNEFQRLLKVFHETLQGATTAFIRSDKSDEHVETFNASHIDIQDKLVDLLQYTYNWDTKMGSSANKQRVQRNYEWTCLCSYCVWVTTLYTKDQLGPLDRLYAESVEKKKKLDDELQAYSLGCMVDAKDKILERGINSEKGESEAAGVAARGSGGGVKKSRTKSRSGGAGGAAKSSLDVLMEMLADLR